MFGPAQEPVHEDSGHQHGYGDRKSVGCSHILHGAKVEYHQKTPGAKDPVDAGDIDLSAYIRWKFYRHPGPEVKTDGFVDKRKTAAYQGLAGDDGSSRSDKDTGDQKPVGDDGEKRGDA